MSRTFLKFIKAFDIKMTIISIVQETVTGMNGFLSEKMIQILIIFMRTLRIYDFKTNIPILFVHSLNFVQLHV